LRTYSASVVGCGNGGGLSLAAYSDSDRFELTAACDLDADALARITKLYPNVRTFQSHTAMFAESPAEVVSVSTFPPSHAPITFEALKLPLSGILVEKPLGDTADAGRRIIGAVKERSIPMVVPHSWLERDISQEIKRRLFEGEIGDLRLMEVQCREWDIMNAGIHWVHFFLSVIPSQSVRRVMGSTDTTTRTFRDGLQVETMGVTYVQMESGVRLVMQTGDDTEVENAQTLFRFYGSAGTLEWNLQESSFTILNAAHPRKAVVNDPEHDLRSPHRRYVDHLADQMDKHEFDYEIPDLSLTALEICEAAYVSALHRCRVDFPFETFEAPPANDWLPGSPYSGSGGGRDGRALR